jgi:uncharacterized protein YjbI with pentapeptide repeats
MYPFAKLNRKQALILLVIVGVITSALSLFATTDSWIGNWLINFSTGMFGATITFYLIDILIGEREREQEKRENDTRDARIRRENDEREARLRADAFERDERWKLDTKEREERFQKDEAERQKLFHAEMRSILERQDAENRQREIRLLIDQMRSRNPESSDTAIKQLGRLGVLHNGILNNENLAFAHFIGADLNNAHLVSVDFRGAIFRKVQAKEADLRGANFTNATLEHSTFNGASLQGAVLRHAIMENSGFAHVDFEGADLSHANIRNSFLQGATLRRAKLHKADLRGTDLTGAILEGAILHEAMIDETTTLPDGQKYQVKQKLDKFRIDLAPPVLPDFPQDT